MKINSLQILAFIICLGDISYSIYILHILIIKAQLYFLDLNIFNLVISTLILTIIFSSLTYEFIEKKFITISRK